MASLGWKGLKTKRNVLYIRNQSVTRSKLSTKIIKPNQLMTYKANVVVVRKETVRFENVTLIILLNCNFRRELADYVR
jgi:hypothetical protein